MPDSLNILYIQTNGDFGGTETMNYRAWGALTARGHQVDIVILDDDANAPLAQVYAAAGANVLSLDGRHRTIRALYQEIRGLLRRRPYDIVHLFGLRVNLLSRHLARRHTRAAIISGQRGGAGGRLQAWLEWLMQGPVDLYLANSLAGERWLHEAAALPRDRTTTIHSGLDPTPFLNADGADLRAEMGVPPDRPVILHVAHLRPIKDHPTLLRACARLCEEGVGFELWLVGYGPEEARLQALAAELGLADHCRFLGRREDIPALLAAADIAVLCSRQEGLPGALMEAMAAGRPIVATDVGGVPELVLPEETGLLVPPGDPAALAVALRRLLADPALRQTLGDAAQTRLLSHFQLDAKIEALEAVYHRLAQTRR
ncbi:MAG: glycosyltransferase family 4 protein [Anaerolineales bacterium]|nr:glycosyltransferase family 4 protein [Anaerolineales bacterium]